MLGYKQTLMFMQVLFNLKQTDLCRIRRILNKQERKLILSTNIFQIPFCGEYVYIPHACMLLSYSVVHKSLKGRARVLKLRGLYL